MYFIVTQLKNESKRIEEWVDFHIKYGFDKILFYLDYPTDDSVQVVKDLADKYHDRIAFSYTDGIGYTLDKYKSPEDYGGQPGLINRIRRSYYLGTEWIYAHYGHDKNHWIAYIDVDEFIVQTGDTHIYDFLSKVVPEDINRVHLPSYDMIEPTDLDKSVIEQSIYRWSDKTRNYGSVNGESGWFSSRTKSIMRFDKDYIIGCVHHIDKSPCMTTGGDLRMDINIWAHKYHDKEYFKLFHYRQDSLLPIYDELDETALKMIK